MGPMAPSPEKEEEPGWNSMEQPGYMAARRQEAEESEQNPLLSIFFSWLICPDYPLSQLMACWSLFIFAITSQN